MFWHCAYMLIQLRRSSKDLSGFTCFLCVLLDLLLEHCVRNFFDMTMFALCEAAGVRELKHFDIALLLELFFGRVNVPPDVSPYRPFEAFGDCFGVW